MPRSVNCKEREALTLADAGVLLEPGNGGDDGDGGRERPVPDQHARRAQHRDQQQPLQRQAALHRAAHLHNNPLTLSSRGYRDPAYGRVFPS